MNLIPVSMSDCRFWRQCPVDCLRWLLWERNSTLGQEKFRFRDKVLTYFIHPYNRTWANERAVEIPVTLEFLKPFTQLQVLEVGNVLSHYFDSDHIVIDLEEKCRYRTVVNQDFLEFFSPSCFSAVISISTFEHIGWDENPRNEEKVMLAFQKLRSLLAPGGKALVTIPVGYNHFLDECIRQDAIRDAEFHCLKRISEDNHWVETALDEALECEYERPFRYANAVVFILLSEDARGGGEAGRGRFKACAPDIVEWECGKFYRNMDATTMTAVRRVIVGLQERAGFW